MKELYHELLITPSCFPDLFADFLLEYTGEAIEEVECEGKISFIVYSEEDLSPLIQALNEYSLTLSQRVDHHVNYTHSLQQKPTQDWISKYQASITPVHCGDFFIRPSWYPQNDSLVDIVIDPALAFGSGHHETTSACLEILSGLELKDKTILDVGCGSGILSIAAIKKGAKLDACDTDPLATEETIKNCNLNQVQSRNIWQGSIHQAQGTYDLIMANILASVLIPLYPSFTQHTNTGSLILLSGILQNAKASILDQFVGFSLQKEYTKEEWVTLLLIKD